MAVREVPYEVDRCSFVLFTEHVDDPEERWDDTCYEKSVDVIRRYSDVVVFLKPRRDVHDDSRRREANEVNDAGNPSVRVPVVGRQNGSECRADKFKDGVRNVYPWFRFRCCMLLLEWLVLRHHFFDYVALRRD